MRLFCVQLTYSNQLPVQQVCAGVVTPKRRICGADEVQQDEQLDCVQASELCVAAQVCARLVCTPYFGQMPRTVQRILVAPLDERFFAVYIESNFSTTLMLIESSKT